MTFFSWTEPGSSSMAILEIGSPSGFIADEASVASAPNKPKRTELAERKLVLYYDEVKLVPSKLLLFLICAATWENQQYAYAKTKAQISFAVTAKLISAFVFATRIVQFLLYLT